MTREIIHLNGMDIAIIILYILVLLGIGYWASFIKKKKQGETLFLAGNSLGWFAIGLTMWGTNVGPSMLIANASSGFESGIVAGNFSWYAFPFLFLLAFVFAPRYLGAGVMTLPEYMGKKFGENTRNYIAWYSMITIVISWLGLTLFSGSVFMAQILPIPEWLCILILILFSALFAAAGGLKAIAYTNVFQMLLLIGVSVLLVILSVHRAGGPAEIISKTPASYWNLFQPLSDPHYPWIAILLGYPVMGVWFWCTDQSMVQSVLGARNIRQGQLGANFCGWLKLLDIPLFILPGIICMIILPEIQNSRNAYLTLVETVFPAGLTGLVVVVMVAALVSTIGSALNSLSTVFTMDIYVKKYKPGASRNEINLTGRIVNVAGAVLAVLCALGITKIQGLNFFNIFQSVLGFLAPPMASAFLLSVFWKRSTPRAVNLLLTAGTIFSLGTGILYYTGSILTKVHFLLISFLIFITLTVLTIIISLSEKTAKVTVATETGIGYKPSGTTWILWGVLIAVMVTAYICFNGH
jgi:SSS family solute:Na+ symporter